MPSAQQHKFFQEHDYIRHHFEEEMAGRLKYRQVSGQIICPLLTVFEARQEDLWVYRHSHPSVMVR